MDFPKRERGEKSKNESRDHSDSFQPRSKPSPVGIALSILGCVIFLPCWVNLRSMNNFDTDWLNRLVIVGIIGGVLLLTYGVYLVAEQSQIIYESTEQL